MVRFKYPPLNPLGIQTLHHALRLGNGWIQIPPPLLSLNPAQICLAAGLWRPWSLVSAIASQRRPQRPDFSFAFVRQLSRMGFKFCRRSLQSCVQFLHQTDSERKMGTTNATLLTHVSFRVAMQFDSARKAAKFFFSFHTWYQGWFRCLRKHSMLCFFGSKRYEQTVCSVQFNYKCVRRAQHLIRLLYSPLDKKSE